MEEKGNFGLKRFRCEVCTHSWVKLQAEKNKEEVQCPNCGYMTDVNG